MMRNRPGRIPPAGGRGLVVRAALFLVVGGSGLAACMPAAPATPVPATQPPPAPQLTADGRVTVAALEAALRAAGFGLIPATQPYRPSEPGELQPVPRAVFQEVLPADPDAGYVVVYEFADAGTAQSMGQTLARYLASGFGQTGYPIDTRFAVSVAATTVVFSAWSPAASRDEASSGVAFDVVAGFGQPVPVTR